MMNQIRTLYARRRRALGWSTMQLDDGARLHTLRLGRLRLAVMVEPRRQPAPPLPSWHRATFFDGGR